ncbi:MAG: DJ-1/PfpI family protein [Anaerolineaceae bacterium]|nr:DJ-1/PfpI family protein [Anaerolineaceae bacterium]
MKIALFYYDGFAEFEVALAALIFHHEHDIISIALENREYRSEEKQRFCVDQIIKDVDVDSIDLLVIPGGDPVPLVENQELKSFIEKLVSKNKKVGGICGGASLLAGFGILKGKKCTGMTSGVEPSDRPNVNSEYEYYSESIVFEEHVVVDGNIITAQGQAYVEFAVELARQMGIYNENQEEYNEDLKWLKNIR